MCLRIAYHIRRELVQIGPQFGLQQRQRHQVFLHPLLLELRFVYLLHGPLDGSLPHRLRLVRTPASLVVSACLFTLSSSASLPNSDLARPYPAVAAPRAAPRH
ncbi:MAG: hypothetical protein WDN27_01385 [Candidatus Saccharibacteria bacterium]